MQDYVKNDEKMFQPNIYIEVASIISGGDEEIISLIQEAVEDPHAFYEKYYEDEILEDLIYPDDIEIYSKKELMQDILLEVLIVKNVMCERDWKDELEDFLYFVGNMETTKKFGINLYATPFEFNPDQDICTWIYQVNEHLKSSEYALAETDTDSDCYHLSIIKRSDFAHLAELIKAVGFKLAIMEEDQKMT